jgi:hypothetical protein
MPHRPRAGAGGPHTVRTDDEAGACQTIRTDRQSWRSGTRSTKGVRSLGFTSELGRYSPPAQVAELLDLPFTTPNPRIPIL